MRYHAADGSYSTRGPTAKGKLFAEATEDCNALAIQYPHQEFRLVGELGAQGKAKPRKAKLHEDAPTKPYPQKSGPRSIIVDLRKDTK